MKLYNAIIYDLDGTLIDSKKDIATAVNRTLVDFDRSPIHAEDIYQFVGKGVIDLIEGTFGSKDPDLVREVLLKFDEHYTTHCMDESHLYEGAMDLMVWAKEQGIKQAVWTNKPQKWADPICDHLKISDYCSVILGADNGFDLKPDVAGTNYILNQLDVPAKQALMVGDSVVDYQTAVNVNMDAYIFTHGYTDREDLVGVVPHKSLLDTFLQLFRKVEAPYVNH